jgi:prepilin-type N-terminal cleavage/methylation domain-containing protein
MKKHPRGGFTIVEVLIAIIMLSIGVLALASSSGTITRMMTDGRAKTDIAAIAQSMLDSLRTTAYGTTYPSCSTVLVDGSALTPPRPGITVDWFIGGTPEQVEISVVVGHMTGRATRADTVTTSLFCR